MSKYSINWEGKVLDFHWKKLQPFHYSFYIGDIFVGQVFNLGRSWSGVGKNPHILNGFSGFKTRLDATRFILTLEGYYK
jgi:hypothetical protein